ncbi:MAG: universal stress protein [Bacteroidota bacterium]
MYTFEHILVCLDLSEMDDALIRYANYIVTKFKPRSITFLHVMKSYDIPPEMLDAFPHLDKPLTEVVENELQEKIEELFLPSEETRTIVEVTEGVTTDTIVKYTREQNITFTIMGKKLGYKGQGGIVRKVTGIIPSSVLLISETTYPHLEHLLVRMDFSKMSNQALKMALKIKEITGAQISCHHAFKLPLEYFPQGSPEKDKKLIDYASKHSKKEFNKFLKKNKLQGEEIDFTSSLDPENNEADILYRHALTSGADVIIIGSKIKSELADIILDSTSEKLATAEKNIPVLIIKDRKQTIGFLKALFKS